MEPETKTPTRNSFDVNHDDQRVPEPAPSLPVSKIDVQQNLPSVARPIGLADDSDTDFQSAYSASPRESYGSFDNEQGNLDLVNDSLTLQTESQENVEDRLSAPPKTRRERVSSTLTAIIIRESSEPRPDLATNSRGLVASKV